MRSILIVTTVHHPLDARIYQRQLRTLVESGWQVTYAAPFRARGLRRADLGPVGAQKNLRTLDLPRSRGRRRLAGLRAARALISRHGPGHDLVLIHDPELLLAVGRAGNVVWDVHEDTRAALVAKPWLPAPLRALAAWAVGRVERWAQRRVRLLLAEHAYAERFEGTHPVVPNAVDVPDLTDIPFQPRVVYLGTVTVERGATELADLGRLLAPEIELDVIGPAHGQAARILEQAAARGHLTWRGFVPSAAALALLPGAIAGISLLHDLPNYRHSLPTKLLEYMGHGVPAITTPLPLARDLVDRAGGIVVPFGDTRAAVQAVRELWADTDRARAMAAGAHALVAQEYDWAHLGTGFEATLRTWANETSLR